ncbi:hypothetical protein D3C83_86050 [compost metagenome]
MVKFLPAKLRVTMAPGIEYPQAVVEPPASIVVRESPSVGGRKMSSTVTVLVAGGIIWHEYDSPSLLKSIAVKQNFEKPCLIRTSGILK